MPPETNDCANPIQSPKQGLLPIEFIVAVTEAGPFILAELVSVHPLLSVIVTL